MAEMNAKRDWYSVQLELCKRLGLPPSKIRNLTVSMTGNKICEVSWEGSTMIPVEEFFDAFNKARE